jgi:prefoldin subunit 5
MAAATDLLNDDLKELKAEVHALRDDIQRVDKDVDRVGNQVKGLLTSIKLLAVVTLTSVGGSIWWGATLSADLRNLNVRSDDRFKVSDAAISRLEMKVETLSLDLRNLEKRFDKFEAKMDQIVEQTKTKAPGN